VAYPSPFDKVLNGLSFFSFDFISVDCAVENSNHLVSVLAWSAVPLIVMALNTIVYVVRRIIASAQMKEELIRQHTWAFIMVRITESVV